MRDCEHKPAPKWFPAICSKIGPVTQDYVQGVYVYYTSIVIDILKHKWRCFFQYFIPVTYVTLGPCL